MDNQQKNPQTPNGAVKWFTIVIASISITLNVVLGTVVSTMNTRIRSNEKALVKIEVIDTRLTRMETDIAEIKMEVKERNLR